MGGGEVGNGESGIYRNKRHGLSTQITYGLFREINCIHFERTKECLQSRV